MSTRADPVILECPYCRASTDLGPMDMKGKSPAERWGAVVEPAAKVGWKVEINAATGMRRAICPVCVQQGFGSELPDYSGDEVLCPKCLRPGPATQYMRTGDQEALIRSCECCKYAWWEKPADARRPWWKRILRI